MSLPCARGLVEWHRACGRSVVLANGVFDLLHAGHTGYLEAARDQGDVLVVAVNHDPVVRRLKGPGRPVFPLVERLEILSSLACVDACVTFREERVDAVIEALRPNLHVKGTDYTESSVPERDTVIRCGGAVRIVGPAKSRATSEILRRIRTGS
jgi:rfaE bifunctional protein nucleotidyltransferase chain/domain